MSVETSVPSAQELLDRARALGPGLAARAQEADGRRSIPPETIAELKDAGLFRMLQPQRYGGYECEPQAWVDVLIAIASSCPSTGWVFGVVSVHNWQLALFPAETQEEVWGADDQTLVSSSYMPVGKVQRVDGGFRLSGRWGFSSGSDHCDWAFLGAFVPPEDEGGKPDMATFLVPRQDYSILDTWHVSGLKATGSNDIVVEDAFVPSHRVHSFADGFRCSSPGHSVNTGPLYRMPFGQIFVRSVSSPAIGMAQGALAVYLEETRERVGRADGARAADHATTHQVCAEAAAVIDESRLLLQANLAEIWECVKSGEKISLERRIRSRFDSARTVARCTAAVDQLVTISGGKAIYESHPIRRFYRDIHACRAHYANNPERPGANLGRVLLGMDNQDFFL